MTSESWPREPSPRFAQWCGELDEWRDAHAPSGRRFQATAGYSSQLYYEHGGVDEVGTVADLTWLARTGEQIKASQQVVWDVHAREVLEAARALAPAGGVYLQPDARKGPNDFHVETRPKGSCRGLEYLE